MLERNSSLIYKVFQLVQKCHQFHHPIKPIPTVGTKLPINLENFQIKGIIERWSRKLKPSSGMKNGNKHDKQVRHENGEYSTLCELYLL